MSHLLHPFTQYLGTLSGLLLSSLQTSGVRTLPSLCDIKLSPSFYQPHTVYIYSTHTPASSMDFIKLSSQFNHLQSWVLLPEYSILCKQYFDSARSESDSLLYTKSLLQSGDKHVAISHLKKLLPTKSPEVHR